MGNYEKEITLREAGNHRPTGVFTRDAAAGLAKQKRRGKKCFHGIPMCRDRDTKGGCFFPSSLRTRPVCLSSFFSSVRRSSRLNLSSRFEEVISTCPAQRRNSKPAFNLDDAHEEPPRNRRHFALTSRLASILSAVFRGNASVMKRLVTHQRYKNANGACMRWPSRRLPPLSTATVSPFCFHFPCDVRAFASLLTAG